MISFLIDDEELSLTRTQRLFQAAPFPGGHRYLLTVDDPRVGKWFKGLSSTETPSRDQQWQIFYAVERVAGTLDRDGGAASFLMNNVESIIVDGERVTIAGVCSPVMPEPVESA